MYALIYFCVLPDFRCVNHKRNEEFIAAFGNNLRKLRKSKGLTMEKLADAADVEYSQIRNIEHGKINTTISTAYALAKALEVESYALFMFDVSKK